MTNNIATTISTNYTVTVYILFNKLVSYCTYRYFELHTDKSFFDFAYQNLHSGTVRPYSKWWINKHTQIHNHFYIKNSIVHRNY